MLSAEKIQSNWDRYISEIKTNISKGILEASKSIMTTDTFPKTIIYNTKHNSNNIKTTSVSRML